ncbi:melatonin receptor type 1A-like [Exaiptasia diaphana]|uniref:G-protein coupled receptors family 1 profile domain-containing protein n=1 Tax=Exaiptasia diaphana TaxID=2652724 RepID=A0A913YNA4_EXADI|nr:melatonin receptor type 1A-like [Exaiptasia diaphana]
MTANDAKSKMASDLRARNTTAVIFEVTFSTVVFLCSLIGNFLVLFSTYRNSALRKGVYIYIFFLSLNDMTMTMLLVLMSLKSLVLGYNAYGTIACDVQGVLLLASFLVSLFLMSFIAISRYFKMLKTQVYNRVFNSKFGVFSSICMWVFWSMVWTVAVAVSDRLVEFHPGFSICTIDLDKTVLLKLIVLLSVASNYIVIVFCYFKIWRFVRSHTEAMSNSQVNAEEVKTVRILFAIVLAFTLCISPMFLCGFVDAVFGMYKLPRQLYLTVVLMVGLSSIVNPVINGCMNQTYQQEFKKIIHAMNILRCRNRNVIISFSTEQIE